MAQAFEDIRVLDLSNRLSGAWAARLFGDFGAEVILVEDEDGHPLRNEPPFVGDEPGVENSLLHAYVNWNKRSVLKVDSDLRELIASADVVVTTSIELPAELESLPSGAIHLSITPHGLEGPISSLPGNNLTACARSGWCAINQCIDHEPLQLPHNQTGYISGVAGFVGASAALFKSRRTGHGEVVDVSEDEAMACTCAPWAEVGLFIGGENRMAHGPNGPRTRDRAGPLWRARNGHLNFGYGDWAQWTSAFHFLELPEIAEHPDFVSTFGRHQKDTRPVRDGLEKVLVNRDKWDVFHGLAERRCISGVVQNTQELIDSEHLQAREFILDAKSNGKSLVAPGAPARLSATPWQKTRDAPRRGQHSSQIEQRKREVVSKQPNNQLPLHGIRVLCFTGAWSGTFATQLLSLLGADVVQVESRKRPDVWRGAGAPVPPGVRDPDIAQNRLNTNGMYNTVNLNKRAITLDVSQPEGMEIFWRLIPKFDILADNFSPHVMTKWGVTLETLREKRPDIIFASLSGYGRTGPLAEYPANGATTEPMAGLSSIHGYKGDKAQNTGGLIPDPISGYYFAGTILAALHHREKTGEGQRIDLSMIESVAVQMGDAIMECSANGRIREPVGNKHPQIAPYGIYQTQDEHWIAISIEEDDVFSRFAEAIGLSDQRFENAVGRKQHESDLDEVVSTWVGGERMMKAVSMLHEIGAISCRVPGFLEVYRNPSTQFAFRDFLRAVDHPESGTHFMPTNPWVFGSTEKGEIRHSPCFGQHSFEVLNEELGITEEEYRVLEEKGITGTTRI
ncbi:MAG: CoA transferase [Gammaproteobacteria bacterium]|nr:CoA transferase [Gammaproteobacteria bacterium]